MKKLFSLLLSLMLMMPLLSGAFGEETAINYDGVESPKDTAVWYSVSFPLYLYDAETKYSVDMPLYFFDGVEDLPWIDLEEAADILNAVQNSLNEEPQYHLSYIQKGSEILLERENDYSMLADFEENTITFTDFNGFMRSPGSENLIEMLSFSGYNAAGDAELFQRVAPASFNRYGHLLKLDLSSHRLHLRMRDNRGYMPLQMASDFLFAPLLLNFLLFNGQAMFLGNDECFMSSADKKLTPLGELYYSAPPKQSSEALSEFGYNELCMMLDCLYGLKQKHNINSFAEIFSDIAFDHDLFSQNPADADAALNNFITYYLDDLHSTFLLPSWMAGFTEDMAWEYGPSSRLFVKQRKQYVETRKARMGEDILPYQEVGNTAYITFDTFLRKPPSYYYDTVAADEALDLRDTIALIIFAHDRIGREDSPIENVVIDLSNNTGGSVDAALFVISWILGEAEISVEDTFSGAQSTMVYRADVNLDREFNELDTLRDRKVYCLISPISFSCGNLVPAILKHHQAATLIGRTSGGGTCTVQPMSTAWGTMIQISGSSRLSFRKNGSFYDIDEGVEPDVYIDHMEMIYDREKLNTLISNLP